MRKSLVIIGIVLLAAAGVWKFSLSPTWTQRIQPGWNWVTNSLLDQAYPNPTTKKLPEPGDNQTNLYDRHVEVVAADNTPPGAVMLKDSFITKNPSSGKVSYQAAFSAPVDPATGAFVQAKYQGQYFVFPRNVQKTSYTITQANITGLPVSFEKEESVEGLLTYLFSYTGASGAYATSNVPLQAGQIMKCMDDQFIQRFWVEPVTGEIAKMEWGCLSGLYVYDTTTQKYLNPTARWHGISTGDDVLRQVDKIQDQRTILSWVTTYIPLLLLLMGLLLVVSGIVLLNRRSSVRAAAPVANQSPA